MKVRRLALTGIIGIGIYALLGRKRDPMVSMHEEDWPDFGEQSTRRRYKSTGHAIHHLRELAGLTLPLAEVYILRAITPAFREQIMIVTAMANNCSP